jgi:hypothetical protein
MNLVKFLYIQFKVMQGAGLYYLSTLKFMYPQGGAALRSMMMGCLIQTATSIADKSVGTGGNGIVIKATKLWEEDNHLMILFNYPRNGNLAEAGDFTPVYRSHSLVPSSFKQICESQRHQFVDYSALTSQDLLKLLAEIVGSQTKQQSQYALTLDNMLKMVAIYVRALSGIPVIIVGETGCGKTSLIRYLICM